MSTEALKAKPRSQSAPRLDIPEQPGVSRRATAALDAEAPAFRRHIDESTVVDPRVTELAFRRRNRPMEGGEVPNDEVLRGLYFEHMRLAINRQFARESFLPSMAAIGAAVVTAVLVIALALQEAPRLQGIYASVRGLPAPDATSTESLSGAIAKQEAKEAVAKAKTGVLNWLKAKKAEHDAAKEAKKSGTNPATESN